MELLLNLAWLLLALPAYWVWQKQADARLRRVRPNRVSSAQCSLALGCVLLLLFPVVSASDDLHAMRAEMEESTSKRAVRAASSDKTSAWTNRVQAPPAALASAYALFAPDSTLLGVSDCSVRPLTRSSLAHAGRAPPFSLLG
jgi:hypothetical protein